MNEKGVNLGLLNTVSFVNKSYIDRNYNSPNPLRRLAHRSRFAKSINALNLDKTASVMDFGCGDGLFLNQLKGKDNNHTLIGFEPFMQSISENKVSIVKEWSTILDHSLNVDKFDYVTCFEVLEHFSPSNQEEALRKMHSIVKDEGKVVISVPIEKGFPALVKNLIRRVNLPQSNHIFSFKNILDSLQGKPLLHLREDPGYMSHMGFYFTDLESEINKYFVIEKKSYSPFAIPTHQLNSQIFYTLSKRI